MGDYKKYRKICAPRIKFRECRDAKGMTLKTLAGLCDVTETTIRNVEAGRGFPSQELMVKATVILNADVFELFPDSPLLKHLKQVKFSRG